VRAEIKKARLEETNENVHDYCITVCGALHGINLLGTSGKSFRFADSDRRNKRCGVRSGHRIANRRHFMGAATGEAAVNEFGSKAAIDAFEALSGPIGAGLSASSPSYTASPEMDEVTPLPADLSDYDGSGFVNSYLQDIQTQQDAQYKFDGLYNQWHQKQLKNMKPAPTGPSISVCPGCTRAQ
jgi:hypothetical protein